MFSPVSVFGSAAVTTMMVAYWLESRSKWYVLVFAAGSAATSVYSGMLEAYPITAIEAIWALVALRRFLGRWRREAG